MTNRGCAWQARAMHWVRAVGAVSLLAFVATACGAGPSDRPGFAVNQPGAPPAPPATSAANPAPPAADVPKSELSWRPCAAQVLDPLRLGAPPEGLIVECANIVTAIDPGGSVYGNFRSGAVRARLPQTPASAAPLVVTAGSDQASSAVLASLAVGGSTALLQSRPLVALDRRGTGTSPGSSSGTLPLTCIPVLTRNALYSNAAGRPGDPGEAMRTLSQEATQGCRDSLAAADVTYDAAHAAGDLDQLRKQWQAERISILGLGNGATVALAYAKKFPQRLSRLILDSPEAAGADAITRAQQRAEGAEAALNVFAQRCTASNCALGPDPRGAVRELLARATAGQLPSIPPATLTTAIISFLGDARADQPNRTAELAGVLAAARDGDTRPLRELSETQRRQTQTDGQFVTRCSDAPQSPSAGQATELAKSWSEKYPVFGPQIALGTLVCAAWPSMKPPPTPDQLPMPVLLLSGSADPIFGGAGVASVTGVLNNAKSTVSTVSWQGHGHLVATHSACAQQHIAEYTSSATLPGNATACPA